MRIETIESHAAGEPLRVIVEGWPPIPGATILEKRAYAKTHHDSLRRALMLEPRGHADMYGAIVTDPVTADGDFGVLFLHNEGFSTMCGHGIIALVTVLAKTGKLNSDVVRIDTPAGRVTAKWKGSSVAFENVASFVQAADQEVDVPEVGRVRYDLAFGGAYYAYCDAHLDRPVAELIDLGMRIKRAVMASQPIQHPFEKDLGFLYGTILCEGFRNVCVFADGQVDRSPTGTGVSGRVAIEYTKGRIDLGDAIEIESIVKTKFIGRALRKARFGPYGAVIPEVEGSAYITGRAEFAIDPEDPLRDGFLLR